MTRRRAGLLVALGALVLLLFAGRWGATVLADYWWGAQFSPAIARFQAERHLLRLVLDVAAVTLATAWFTGHLLLVLRAVDSVQVPRHVGNLEFREAVRAETLLALAVGVGLLLGLLVGVGASAWWREVALAFHGVESTVVEPFLGRSAGYYLASLPVLRHLQEFAMTLALGGVGLVILLYGLIGALTWSRAGPAINDHARIHLGGLLAAHALVLAWGFHLEPAEYVAALRGAPTVDGFRRAAVIAPALTGTALMAAALSVLWAVRSRHALLAAGWAVLVVATAIARLAVPLAVRSAAATPLSDSLRLAFEDAAFGLAAAASPGFAVGPAPLVESEWVRQMFGDPAAVRLVSGARIAGAPGGGAAWLALVHEGGGAAVHAVAAGVTGAAGTPLGLQPGDSLAYPALRPVATLGAGAVWPGSPEPIRVEASRGVPADGPLRRVVLAWALQHLGLRDEPAGAVALDWVMHPVGRLEKVAPFAYWSPPRLAVHDGRVLWMADGYVHAGAFPLVPTEPWAGGSAATLEAGYLGVVDAATGQVTLVLRRNAGPLATAWAELARNAAVDEGDVASGLVAAGGPAVELFEVQARLHARRAGGLEPAPQPSGDPLLTGWDTAGRSTVLAPFTAGDDRIAMVLASRAPGELARIRADSGALRTPRVLDRLWDRFATFAVVEDSVAGAGARLSEGRVHVWSSDEGLAAFQVRAAAREGARPALVWVSVATAGRLGAGRSFSAAWRNLAGADSIPPEAGADRISAARRWMRLADEALRRGDWEAFGRAFESLRQTLDPVEQ